MEDKKQEIVSLIEKMDEDSLDKILYFIKLQPKRKVITTITPDVNAKKTWNDVCMFMMRELTEVSYNTWIKNIIPMRIEKDIFILSAENAFQLEIIKTRYSNLIKTALMYNTGIKFELRYLFSD